MKRTRTSEGLGSRTDTRDVHAVWISLPSLVESMDRLTASELLLDIPAHTYQATFEPNKAWSQFYASAKEIHQYWKGVVQKYGCMRYIKLKQRTVEAVWDENNSKWNLKVGTLERLVTEWKAADELGTGPKC